MEQTSRCSLAFTHRLRPLAVGGFDLSTVFGRLETSADDVVLDVRCGTGFALDQLSSYQAYHGFDPDERAIEKARSTHSRPNTHLNARIMTAADVETLRPTKVLLLGLLDVPDDEVRELLRILRIGGTVRRVITWDPVYRPGKYIKNILGRLVRREYVRYEEGYVQLVESAGWDIVEQLGFQLGKRHGVVLFELFDADEIARQWISAAGSMKHGT